ncbi:ABC transporter substrate-binding protein [Microbacterium sp. NPDC087589]|uniref:ABC transporter substrate-binding protein n=1 Tax=Microbacterium sp. NPDC087589 TaxID=3364191 RepID=UPI003805DF6D
MNNSIRALAAVVAIAATAAPLAACAGQAGDGSTTLTYYSWNNQESMKPIIDAFEEANPGITIDMSSANGGAAEYAQTLLARASGNQLPDVFHLSLETRNELIEGGVVRDITNEPFMEGIDATASEMFTVDDKTYGMSTGAWQGVIIYNKALLEQVGFEEVPTDLDGFIELGLTLKGAGIDPYLEDESSGSPSFAPMLGGWYAGSGTTDAEIFDGSESFSSWIPVMEQWQKLVDSGVLPTDVVGVSGDQVKQNFLSGQVAMYRSGPWDFADIEAAGVDFGTAPFPAIDGGEPFIGGGPDSPFALSGSLEGDKLAAAQKFLSFINSAEGLELAEKYTNQVSTSAKYDAKVAPQIEDVYKNYVQEGKYYWINWPANGAVMGQELAAQFQLFIQGQATPEDVTSALDAKWESQ